MPSDARQDGWKIALGFVLVLSGPILLHAQAATLPARAQGNAVRTLKWALPKELPTAPAATARASARDHSVIVLTFYRHAAAIHRVATTLARRDTTEAAGLHFIRAMAETPEVDSATRRRIVALLRSSDSSRAAGTPPSRADVAAGMRAAQIVLRECPSSPVLLRDCLSRHAAMARSSGNRPLFANLSFVRSLIADGLVLGLYPDQNEVTAMFPDWYCLKGMGGKSSSFVVFDEGGNAHDCFSDGGWGYDDLKPVLSDALGGLFGGAGGPQAAVLAAGAASIQELLP